MVRPLIFLSLLGLAAASPRPPHKLVPAKQGNFTTNSNSTRNSTTALSPLEMAMKANIALHHVPRAPIISIDYNDPSTQAASGRDTPKTLDLGKRDDEDD
ncbi:hypothetical protein NpPPO83_00004927 [Neofusicoccum parvum]|uniref:Uncharacterized protein n=1 Tax=Neofusicoccum parvum TaxID=310453 RepID=A0ACB5SH49_9PEZI|nr:hypothetical protein NpPPO83_00004927 [Neofusicoccum parvum]